jgi:hypothetical protein
MSLIRLHTDSSKYDPFLEYRSAPFDVAGVIHFNLDEGLLFPMVSIDGVPMVNLNVVNVLIIPSLKLLGNTLRAFQPYLMVYKDI